MILLDKIVVITGGNSGIGQALAYAFARKGSIVVILARNKQRLQATLQYLQVYNKQSAAYVCDVTQQKKVEHTFKAILKKYGSIDILVNNAGFGMYRGFHASSIEDFRSLMNTNYFGTVYCTKAVLPSMLQHKKGRIVNIASVAGKAGFPGNAGYCASKFAVVGLSEVLHYELKDKGIAVHLICPGAVETAFPKNSPGYEFFDHKRRHTYIITPEDVAKATLDALEKNRFETVIPREAAMKIWGKGIVPGLWRKVLYKITRGEKY